MAEKTEAKMPNPGPCVHPRTPETVPCLVGEVMLENKPMLQVCRELGLVITPDPNNAPIVLLPNGWQYPDEW
jgi:hypothetical protein